MRHDVTLITFRIDRRLGDYESVAAGDQFLFGSHEAPTSEGDT